MKIRTDKSYNSFPASDTTSNMQATILNGA